MKIVNVIALFACVSGASASANWGLKSPALSRILTSTRGGADGILGTPVTTDILAALYIAETALAGSIAVPFPEGGDDNVYGMAELGAGSMEAFCVRTAGYSKLNAGIFTYLSIFKDMAPELAIAYSVCPCTSTILSSVLTGEYEAQGCKKGFGTANLVAFLGCQYAIFSGSEYSTLAAQFLAGYHIAFGALGVVMPKTAGELMGADMKDDRKVSFFRSVFSYPILNIGVAFAAALNGASAVTVLGYRTILDSAMTVFNIVGKDGGRLELPEKTLYGLLALSSIIGLGIQLNDEEE